jgi:TRAP-type mannitol/chloroaromatic compound transport system permease large subunit
MEQISIMLITLPIFMPLVAALHFDPIWFAVLMLVNLETALMTPPLGLLLVVIKGVAPPETTFGQIWIAAAPYVICNIIVIVFLLSFQEVITAVVNF